ncbi:MAG: hypothetical protein HKN87_06750 [Saprospiraceae bacterium]|nr:hypothetical protein [Saprospiraceae bacterium]
MPEIDVVTTGSENKITLFFINRNHADYSSVVIDLSPFKMSIDWSVLHVLSDALDDTNIDPARQPYMSISTDPVRADAERLIAIQLPERSVAALVIKLDE